jgi:hypothetical protein
MTTKKFCEICTDSDHLEGDKVKVKDILGKELLFTKYNLRKSKVNEGSCLTIQFQENDSLFISFTGSQVLCDQFTKYGEHLPFMATIKELGKSYSLT